MQFGISEAVEHWGKYRPNSIAIYRKETNITYHQLNTMINHVCFYINKSYNHEKRIGLAINNKLKFLVSLISILRLGKSPVILNIGLPEEALEVNVKDTKLKMILYDTEKILLIKQKHIIYTNINNIYDICNTATDFHTYFRNPSDEWGVVFSSGTTGIPKGIERDHNSIITELIGWCLELCISRKTNFYIGRPIYYTGGLVLTLSTLLVSGKIIINDFKDDNDPTEIWTDYQNVLENISINWGFFVPDQLRAFINTVKYRNTIPKNSDTILTMGAPISGDEKKDVVEYLKSDIVESWGNSESLGTITDTEDVLIRPNSIGRPFLTDDMSIVDDQGNELVFNEYGRIAGGEEAGFLKYSNRPEETNRVKKQNLIISDDIGYVDKEGYFYVCGRRQDMIVSNNEVIFIPDLEERTRKHPLVNECCIITKTFKDGKYHLIAVIVPSPGIIIKNTDLKNQLNCNLNNAEKFTDIFLLDTLPKLPSGKIDKISLSNQLIK